MLKSSPFLRLQKILVFRHFITLALKFAGSTLLINIPLEINSLFIYKVTIRGVLQLAMNKLY